LIKSHDHVRNPNDVTRSLRRLALFSWANDFSSTTTFDSPIFWIAHNLIPMELTEFCKIFLPKHSFITKVLLEWINSLMDRLFQVIWKARCDRIVTLELQFNITKKDKKKYKYRHRQKKNKHLHKENTPEKCNSVSCRNLPEVNGIPIWLILVSSNYLHSGSLNFYRNNFMIADMLKLDSAINIFFTSLFSSFFSSSSYYSFHPYINSIHFIFADRMS